MNRWPCEVCAGPIITLGEAKVTCPRAHYHCVCVDCQVRMFGNSYVGRESNPLGGPQFPAGTTIPNRRCERAWWLKIRRCPADVTEADRALWALATPEPTFGEDLF